MGGDPLAFWKLTPFQARVWIDGTVERMQTEAKMRVAQAWHSANFGAAAHVGKLPPLDDVLGGKPKKMSADQIKAFLMARAST